MIKIQKTLLHLCDTGKVHEGEVEDPGRENPESNGLPADPLVRSRDTVGFLLNLGPDLVKVGEHLLGNVGELGPLGALLYDIMRTDRGELSQRKKRKRGVTTPT